MKKIFSFIVGVSAGFACAAQTPERADHSMWTDRGADTMMVFGNTAYVRASAGMDAVLTDSLVAGELIVLSGNTKIFSALRDIYAPWVPVTYTRNGKPLTGFMWAGVLALGYTADATNTFLYGIQRITSGSAAAQPGIFYHIQLKALDKSGKVVAIKEWKLPESESLNYSGIKLLGDTRLRNLPQVVRLMFGGEACGIPSDYYYSGFTGTAFLELPGKMCVGDAGVFHHEEVLLFPNEKEGKEGQIIRITKEEEVLEEETATHKAKVKRSSKREVYTWDGSKAVLQKKSS